MNNYDFLVQEYCVYEQASITDWILGLNIIFNSISPINNKIILDYGCGTGRFTRFLNKHGGHLIGVDISRKMLDLAMQANTLNIKYHLIQSGELNFLKSNVIDAITTTYVICTISSRQEIIKIFKEMFRVLKNDGKLIILDNNWEKSQGKDFISHKLDAVENLKSGQTVGVTLKSNPEVRIKDYFWSKDDYCDMLHQAGFSVHSIQEPKAIDNDYPWIDEKQFPASLIITANKT